MPTLTKLKDGVLAVTGLPEDYWAHHVNQYNEIESYPKDGGGGTKPIGHHFDLPPGSWDVLGWSDELTDDQLCKLFETPSKLMARLTFDMKLLSHSITDKALIIVNKEK